MASALSISVSETIAAHYTPYEKSIIERTIQYIKKIELNALTIIFDAKEKEMQTKACKKVAVSIH